MRPASSELVGDILLIRYWTRPGAEDASCQNIGWKKKTLEKIGKRCFLEFNGGEVALSGLCAYGKEKQRELLGLGCLYDRVDDI